MITFTGVDANKIIKALSEIYAQHLERECGQEIKVKVDKWDDSKSE